MSAMSDTNDTNDTSEGHVEATAPDETAEATPDETADAAPSDETEPPALTDAAVRALYTRGLIDKATWAGVLRTFRGPPTPMGLHALHTCELAVEVLVEEAINAACRTIQDRLGVETGDLAAVVLSGGTIERELIRYVHAELEAASAPSAESPEGETP